jgi:hypothetical protein
MNRSKCGIDQRGSGSLDGHALTEGNAMKRAILVTILLLGTVLAAKADNDTYVDTTRHGRGNDALDVDASTCDQMLGSPKNGQPTSPQYKRCMLKLGWRWKFTTLSPTAKPSSNATDDDDWSFTGCTFNPASSSDC